MNMNRKSLFWILCIVAGVIVLFVYIVMRPAPSVPTVVPDVMNFEDCVASGYPITENPRRQCQTPDGRRYTEELAVSPTYSNASSDDIVVQLPFPGAVTGKGFSVLGQARGTWYFEASFPVQLLDTNGKILVTAIAHAQGDWMTTDFVPFVAEIAVPESYIGPAVLLLKKDNPSGIPENDASIAFPITVEY